MNGRTNKKKPKIETENSGVLKKICVYNDRWGIALCLIQVASFNCAVAYCG